MALNNKNRARKLESAGYDPERLPEHIAIIMDGNGRWAKKRGLPRTAGHSFGAENFRTIATFCRDLGIKYLTVYAFSTENWKRSSEEVAAIWELLRQYLSESIEKMENDRVKIKILGDMSGMPQDIQALVRKTDELSKRFEGITLCICLNYGGRSELAAAAREIARMAARGELSPDDVDEAFVASKLYSAGIPDPDLVIRPSGELRLSNFLTWQCAYSELYFTDTLWPDFSTDELVRAIGDYQSRDRRFGG